ncbi:MAG: hypothetical protein KU28_02840 [Sulfurovum sp. PC08-66]|jgi:hypothetical protein|nr:MAG: hypothetical protein KU28_02840 [Sulfurovum sp. PC08-66]
MYEIYVTKECGCFKKSPYENHAQFQTRADAKLQVGLMVNHMNTKFCKKHEFELFEEGEHFKIVVDERSDPYGCCSGGHCS